MDVFAGRTDENAVEPEDAELVAALRAGSTDALETLFRRHGRSIQALALRITGSRAEAEDVVQDVFTGLRRALDRYEEQGRFDAWLRKVAARTALMRVRRRRRRETVPLDDLVGATRTDAAPIVDRLVARAALADLPEGQRRVFLLREVEGYSHAEIAEMLEITSAASRVRLHRAWTFLEKRLETAE